LILVSIVAPTLAEAKSGTKIPLYKMARIRIARTC
jgi:hypothetical protein